MNTSDNYAASQATSIISIKIIETSCSSRDHVYASESDSDDEKVEKLRELVAAFCDESFLRMMFPILPPPNN